jgi:hypothetical protein
MVLISPTGTRSKSSMASRKDEKLIHPQTMPPMIPPAIRRPPSQ